MRPRGRVTFVDFPEHAPILMRPAHRRYAAMVLALYALIAGGLPVVDAMFAGPSPSTGAQVEETPAQHRSSHDHLSCQLCRTMDRNLASGGGDRVVLHAAEPGPVLRTLLSATAPETPPRAALRARAPPLG